MGPLALKYVRHYNSLDGQWRHAYRRAIQTVDASHVIARRDDGHGLDYALVNGLWYPWQDNPYELTKDPVSLQWTLKTPDGDTETYGSNGRLLSIENRAGQSITLSYNAGNLVEAVDFTGRTIAISYDASGRVGSFTDPAGNVVTYGYDAQGRLTSVAYPDDTPGDPYDNPTRFYHYEDSALPNALTGITDENGDRFATFTYDSTGQPILTEHAGGADRIELAYNPDGTVTTTNALGKLAVYSMDLINGVRQVTEIAGQATALCGASTSSVTYDSNGYRDLHTDENGNVTDFDYDEQGLLVSRTEALNTPQERTTLTTWDSVNRVPTQIVEPGRTIDMTYDPEGRLLTRTVTDTQTQAVPYSTLGKSRTTTYTYNAQGLVQTIDGPRSDVFDVTEYQYDTNGDLLAVCSWATACTDAISILARDARGLPTQISDANGTVTTLSYDARGRLISRSMGFEPPTMFQYDAAGQLVRITLADQVTELFYEYDEAHRLVAIEGALGHRVEYTLDAAGNRTQEDVLWWGMVQKTAQGIFDELSRLRQLIGGSFQTEFYDYDANGNLVQTVDGLFNATTQAYDALDRLVQSVDPQLNPTQYAYDARDNLISVTDARGNTTTYVYDGLDNLIQESSPDSGTTVHEYDAAGNRIRTTDARGVVTEHTHDYKNRVLTTAYPANPSLNVTYEYDQSRVGSLYRITDSSGSSAYDYDDRGNVTRVDQVIQGALYSTEYEYDVADRVTQVSYPSGLSVTTSYDANGRPFDVVGYRGTPSWQSFDVLRWASYLAFGPLETGQRIGSQTGLYRTYDQAHRPLAWWDGDLYLPGSWGRDYFFDANDNVTDIQAAAPSSTADLGYYYDTLNRLTHSITAEGGNSLSYDYGYDALGNRQWRDIFDGSGSISESYGYDPMSNRLQSIQRYDYGVPSLRSFAFSAAGSVESDTTYTALSRTLGYDEAHRLVSVTDATGTLGSYVYNGLGQRVAKTAGGVTTHFVYGLGGELLAEVDAVAGAVREYVYVEGALMAVVTPTGEYTVYGDHLGTPHRVVDGNANPVWEARYAPFGEADPLINAVDMPIRFPGQYHDAETGMHYNYFRTYDPSVGRYTTSDPIGLNGGMNVYGHVENNPLRYADPFGLAPDWVGPAGAVVAATGLAGFEASRHIPVPIARAYVVAGSAALIVGGGALIIWDGATTPAEQAERIQDSEAYRQLKESQEELKRVLEGLSLDDKTDDCE